MFVGLRPFEVLELALPATPNAPTREQVAFDSVSLSRLFEGRCDTFMATVRWLPSNTDAIDLPPIDLHWGVDPDPGLVSTMSPMIDEWLQLVRTTGRERTPGQLDRILRDLGSARPTDPLALALYVAALINPLPALGVAPEVRGAVLEDVNASDVRRAIQRVHWGLTASIQNMLGMPITPAPNDPPYLNHEYD